MCILEPIVEAVSKPTSPVNLVKCYSVSIGFILEIQHFESGFVHAVSVTTDVQTPAVVVNSKSVIIRCDFIPGSLSRGCHVKIDGLGPSTLTRNLERSDGINSLQQEIEIPEGIGRDVDLSIAVFDWRSDGTVGNLSISLDIVDMRGATTEGNLGFI